MKISGYIESVIFNNEDTGYSVLSVSAGKTFFTLVGNFISINAGEYIEAEVEKVGFDINQIDTSKNSKAIKGINIITKGMSITAKIIFVSMIIFFILALVYVYFWTKPSFERLDVDIEGAISGKHQIELITVSKNADKKGNKGDA